MDKYQLVKQLGRGNFGVVSVVRSRVDQQQYVLKEIDLTKLDEDVKRAALGEAQLLSSLHHPCIVGYIESFITDAPPLEAQAAVANTPAFIGGTTAGGSKPVRDTLVIVMEYCAGGDVGEVIRRMKLSEPRQHRGTGEQAASTATPFKEEQILDWFIQLALALKYIHSNHILHRDLKAANVFLTKDSRVKLGDFGISKVLNSEADFARTVIGTPYYLSPEICEGKQYAKKSDVWSLGLFLYELCTLKHAFDAATLPALVMRILKGSYPPISSGYSDQLKALIGIMLSLNPAKRPNITQILRLEFVRARMAVLAHKYPDLKQSWDQTMKLGSMKELFLQNALPPQMGAAAPPQLLASPTSSASARRKSSAHPPSASHKPVSSSAAAAAKRAPPATATPASRTKSRMSSAPSNVAARPRTPPPVSSSSRAAAAAAPPPSAVRPPPVLMTHCDDDDDDDDDDEEDEEEEGLSTPSHAAAASSFEGPGSPSREPIIKSSWFDAAAQEYEALMAFSADNAPASSPDMHASESPPDVAEPSTPRKRAPSNAAAAGSAVRPSASAAKLPATAAPASRHRSALGSAASGASSASRRRSDGGNALVTPAAKAMSIPTRGRPSASPQPPSASHAPSPAVSSPDDNGAGAAAMLSPLAAMMAEIEEQKRRARQWKRDRASAKAELKAAEAERIAKHKAQLKAIKSRPSIAGLQPSPSPLSAAASAGGDDDLPDIGDPLVASRAQSEPQHHLAAPSDSRRAASSRKSGAVLASPTSARSPSASSPVQSAKKAPGRRKTMAPSPSPRSRSPTAAAAGAGGGSHSASSSPEKPRVSVRDFISARKKEAAAAAAAQGVRGVLSPTIEVITSRPHSSSDDATAADVGAAIAAASLAPAAASVREPSPTPVSSIASAKAAAKKGGKREIQFELVLQSSAQAAAVASSDPPVSSPVPAASPAPVTRASTRKRSPSPPNTGAASAAAAVAPLAAAAPPLTRQHSRGASDALARAAAANNVLGATVVRTPFGSPSDSPHDFTVQYAAYVADPAAAPSSAATSAAQLVRDMMARNGGNGAGIGVIEAAGATPAPAPLPPANSGVQVSIAPIASSSSTVASPQPPVAAVSPPASSPTGAPPARSAQLSFQISQARSLCSSMLGDDTFARCYNYLKEAKVARKAVSHGTAPAGAAPPPSEAEQERVVKSWLTPDQHTAYGHITSLLFCEELLSKM